MHVLTVFSYKTALVNRVDSLYCVGVVILSVTG